VVEESKKRLQTPFLRMLTAITNFGASGDLPEIHPGVKKLRDSFRSSSAHCRKLVFQTDIASSQVFAKQMNIEH